MRRRHAFTLVELLVVIGIIALLISILLPALNGAREAAKNTMCLSNLRQFAIGIRLYAESNKGLVIEPYLDGGDYTRPQTGPTTVNPNTTYDPLKTTLYHVGRLWQQRYVQAPKIAFCPSNFNNPDFGWDRVANTWPVVPGSAVRSDYMYSPHWRYQGGTPNRGYYRRLQDFPNTRMLAADLLRSTKYQPHRGRGVNPNWNVVFTDGHAVSVFSKEIWNQLLDQGEYGNDGPGWNKLENYRDMLETVAAGRPLADNPQGFGKGGGNESGRVYHVKGERGCGQGTLDGRPKI